MPLVIFCGYPSSGKTRRCKQLVAYLKEHNGDVPVVVVSENEELENKNETFGSSQTEKGARGCLKSKVNQHLNKKTIVVLDALNYIKGYRYELNCISKYAQTTQCVIHTAASNAACHGWNSARSQEEQYKESIFDALIMRFEAPDSRNRWDSPLFTVNPDDELPCKKICDALLHGKKPLPNNSTQNPPLMSAEFLYEVDKKTQEVISAVLSAQKSCVPGDMCMIPEFNINFTFTKKLTLPALRRHKQQFVSYIKTNATIKLENVPRTFILFLQKSLD